MDRIDVTISAPETLREVIVKNEPQIRDETLAESLTFAAPQGYVKDWNINGEAAVFGVEKQ